VAVWTFKMFFCLYWTDYIWLSHIRHFRAAELFLSYFSDSMCLPLGTCRRNILYLILRTIQYVQENVINVLLSMAHGTVRRLETITNSYESMLLSKNYLLIIYSCFVFHFTLYFILLHISHKIWSLGDRFIAI